MFRGRFLLTVTIRLLLISSLTLGQTNHPTEIVEGSWTDVCPCDIPCTCWKTYKSTTDRCVNFHIFRVDRGAYESADLAGAIFIVMSIPSTPYESPDPAILYVDKSLSPKKIMAIRRLVANYYRRDLPIEAVPVKFETQNSIL